MTAFTVDPDLLTADQLAHLGASFAARAIERRRVLTADECRTAIASAPLSPAWQRSQLSIVGRVRTACRILVGDHRLHPEQVVDAMTFVAEDLIGLGELVATEAVKAGCLDGMAYREGAEA